VIEPLRRLLPGLWAGLLLGVATLGTPAPFAVLARADAGRVVGHIFEREAWVSLLLAVLLLAIERQRARRAAEAGQGSVFSTEMVLVLAAVFATVAGYFGLLPMMAQARAGQGALSFGQLHLISTAFFAVKLLAVLALAWRGVRSATSS
jgi:Domain of unknown function (DUF4149)